jgi:hypothetical protein
MGEFDYTENFDDCVEEKALARCGEGGKNKEVTE